MGVKVASKQTNHGILNFVDSLHQASAPSVYVCVCVSIAKKNTGPLHNPYIRRTTTRKASLPQATNTTDHRIEYVTLCKTKNYNFINFALF